MRSGSYGLDTAQHLAWGSTRHGLETSRSRVGAASRAALQPPDDVLRLVPREGPERLGRDISVLRDADQDLGRSLVVRGLEDLDDVVTAERDEDVDEAAPALLDLSLALLEAVPPGGEAAQAPRRPLHQRDVH